MSAHLVFMEKFDSALTSVLKFVTVVLFVVLMLILTANVAARLLPFSLSLHWLDEIVELCFAGLVFYGAAAVWMTKGHFSAGNWVAKVCKSPRLVGLYRVLVELASLVFIGIFFKYSLNLTLRSSEVTAVFQIPKWVLYSTMPISAAIMVLYSMGTVLSEILGLCKPISRTE
jgi:TRAP-type C4-dicarboxylate transport system permease small subunit